MANGFALGGFGTGFSRAFDAGQQRGLQGRQLDIQEKNQEFQAQKIKQAESEAERKALQNDLTTLRELIAEAAKTNPEKARRLLEVMGQKGRTGASQFDILSLRAKNIGLNLSSEMITRDLENFILAQATPEESGERTGREKAAEVGTLSQIPGADRQAVLEQQGLSAPIDVINFQLPNGELVAVDKRNTERVQSIVNAGGVRVGLSVQAARPGDLRNLTGLDKKRVGEIRESLDSTQGSIENLKRVINDFKANPEAGGIAGTAIENVGGLIKQLPLIGDMADETAKSAGIDVARVTEIRTGARLVIANLLETVTGETSGRFTDTERKIAEEIQKTLSPTASNEQIVAAGGKVLEIMQASQVRKANQLLQQSDLEFFRNGQLNTNAVDKFGEILISNGFTEDQAVEMIIDLIERQ